MSDAAVEVSAPIEEGTIVVLRNVDIEGIDLADVVEQMGHVAGHDRFLVLWVGGSGEVETWGPDTDVRARVEALIEETRARRPVPPPRRTGGNAGWQGGDGRRPAPASRP